MLNLNRSNALRARWIAIPILAVGAVVLILGAATASATPPPPEGLPDCEVAERPAANSEYDDWERTLVDPALTLGPSYRPPDLQDAVVRGRYVTLRVFVIRPLQMMVDAAANSGNAISVNSSYRSYAAQARLLASNPGHSDTIARPGHSEHQLGTTVDLAGGGAWLRDNAWRYGFVLSFPAGRSPQWTCYRDEPWHFRYFGPDRAAAIEQSGLSPREFLWAEQEGRL